MLYITGRSIPGTEPEGAEAARLETVVAFDRADVHWLRGYCSLLRGLVGFVLAHDQEEMWHVFAHRIFAEPDVKFDFLIEEEPGGGMFSPNMIIDAIAGIHNFHWPVIDPQKMAQSRGYVLEMIVQSRLMWQEIRVETDNDREWIPAPDQQSAVTAFEMTEEMVATWHEFPDEGEKVLNGELLIPFWRGTNEKLGVNLARVFEEPTEFDLVLWIHGSAVVPYLEEGELTSPETWDRFQQTFRGNFVGFAIWVN